MAARKKATRKKSGKKAARKTGKKASRRASTSKRSGKKRSGKKKASRRKSTAGSAARRGDMVNLTTLVKQAEKGGLQVWACEGRVRTGCGGGKKGRGGSRMKATMSGGKTYGIKRRRK